MPRITAPPAPRRRPPLAAVGCLLTLLVVAGLVTIGPVRTAHAAEPSSLRSAEAAGRGWTWPLDPPPAVVHGFEPPDAPWGSGHRGVDLRGTAGQPVRSAGAGTVAYAGMLAGRGVITVSHGDLRTTYEPVRATVAVGTEVAAGDVLGTLETALGHCLPRVCLHWGLRRGDVYLNPLDLLADGPARLLPLGTEEDEVHPLYPSAAPNLDPLTPAAEPPDRALPTGPPGRDPLGYGSEDAAVSSRAVWLGALVGGGGFAVAGLVFALRAGR